MTSIVIAAHNEESVIGRCLDGLLRDAVPGEFDVTVVANGCTDRTASVAGTRTGVRVLDIPEAGKANALNAGDAVAVGFPRIYLDADIAVTTNVARALRDALATDSAEVGPLAAVPRRELDVADRPILVRSYYAISSRLPVFRDGLFGRGMIALSADGRARFGEFPILVADDLFLDSQFAAAEKTQVDAVATVVATPRRTRDLVRRLTRVRRGNTSLRAARQTAEVSVDVRPADRTAWFREVVAQNPRLAPAALAYVSITALAAILARRTPASGTAGWGHDKSTRGAPSGESE